MNALSILTLIGIFFLIGVCCGIAIEEHRNNNPRYPYAKASDEEMRRIFLKIAAGAKENAHAETKKV